LIEFRESVERGSSDVSQHRRIQSSKLLANDVINSISPALSRPALHLGSMFRKALRTWRSLWLIFNDGMVYPFSELQWR
jgi:hypothetical protein